MTGYVAAFLRGDREANMIKVVNALGIPEHAIAFADEAKMAEMTRLRRRIYRPVGLKNCTIIADSELPDRRICAPAPTGRIFT